MCAKTIFSRKFIKGLIEVSKSIIYNNYFNKSYKCSLRTGNTERSAILVENAKYSVTCQTLTKVYFYVNFQTPPPHSDKPRPSQYDFLSMRHLKLIHIGEFIPEGDFVIR